MLDCSAHPRAAGHGESSSTTAPVQLLPDREGICGGVKRQLPRGYQTIYSRQKKVISTTACNPVQLRHTSPDFIGLIIRKSKPICKKQIGNVWGH